MIQNQLSVFEKTKQQLENIKNKNSILEESMNNIDGESKKKSHFLNEQLKQVQHLIKRILK